MAESSRFFGCVARIWVSIALSFGALSYCLAADGNVDRLLTRAFDIGKTIENPFSRAEALGRVAEVRAKAGQYEQAMAVADAIEGPYPKSTTLVKLSDEAWKQGRPDLAGQARAKARETADSIDRPKWKAAALVAVARSYAKAEQIQTAGEVVEQAVKAAEGADDTQWKADFYVEVGKAYLNRGRKEEGLKHLNRAFEYAKTLEDAYDTRFSTESNRITVMDRIAEEFRSAGEAQRAQQVRDAIEERYTRGAENDRNIRLLLGARKYEEAVAAAEGLESPYTRAHTLTGIAIHAWTAGRRPFAEQTMNRAFEAARGVEDEYEQAKALGPVARAYARGGFFAKSEEAVEAIKDPAVKDFALSRLAGLAAEAGKFAEAEKAAGRIKDVYYRAVALDAVAAGYVRAGDKARTADIAAAGAEAAGKIENRYRKGDAYSFLAQRFAEAGRYDQALALADAIQDVYHKSTARYWVAYWSGVEGRYEQAERVAEGIRDPYYQASALTWLAERRL